MGLTYAASPALRPKNAFIGGKILLFKMAKTEMDIEEAKRDNKSPGDLYRQQLEHLLRRQTEERRRSSALGYAKIGLALLALILGLSLSHYPKALLLLLAPIIAFLLAAVIHERVLRSLRNRARTIDFYERGLARLNDRWPGTGETGERFLDLAHPYARDLDLFGTGSLFELLCTTRTRAGEETLAKWLLNSAPVNEIRARQVAISELKERVSFRERLWSLGETVRLGVHPEKLSAWGEAKPSFRLSSSRPLTSALAVTWILSLVCWGIWNLGTFALLMTIVNVGYFYYLHRRLDESANAIETATKDLALLGKALSLLEQEHFVSPKLLSLQTALRGAGIVPSCAIRSLGRIVEHLESRRNPFARITDVLIFWSAQLVYMAERWQQTFGPEIRLWLAAVGEFEALASLSGFAYEHPEDVFPEFVESGPIFSGEGIAHPLLPLSKAVRNNLRVGGGIDLVILSGTNMAGKSTFIRSIGMNVILAQCGATVRAERLTLSPLAVGASICVLDSLAGGTSRFYAEIRRIKLISDLAHGPLPVLFLLDELLSGTNSHDRLAGTEYIVNNLLEKGAIGIVSTHDLALTQIPATMKTRAVNYHFGDSFENGQLLFDYKVKPGVVQTSNALELMRSIGLV